MRMSDWSSDVCSSDLAGYAQSNRAPTPAELSCADENAPCILANFFIADPPLKQVVAKSWEAGAGGQGRWGGFRLEWLLSAYRTRNRDDKIGKAEGWERVFQYG